MKVAIFFEANNFSGGVYNLSMSTINSLNNKELSDIDLNIVTTTFSNIKKLRSVDAKSEFFPSHKLAERFNRLNKIKLFNFIFKKFKIINPFEKFIKKNNYDLIFFLSPSKYIEYSGETNFIVNLFDFNHRIENSFPEYRSKNNIEEIDDIITTSAKKAYKIFVNTDEAKKDLQNLYNCHSSKILILPYGSSLVNLYESKNNITSFLNIFKKLEVSKTKNIFFYPAQFWPHKNHKYLIDAAKILDANNIEFRFIFCGSKKINYDYIVNQIKLNNLNDKIFIYDYLDDDQVVALYLNCLAVVVPTYVGRSSLPLLESFYFKKTIFYSKDILDPALEKFVNAFDLKNPHDLAHKISEFLDLRSSRAQEKIIKAYDYYSEFLNFKTRNEHVIAVLNDFKYLRKRWKN
jgi:glycosyltransferase involved in cell wall biosynthesis